MARSVVRLLLLAILAAGVLAAWRHRCPGAEPSRWVEDDDGVQPPDPWLEGLAGYTVRDFTYYPAPL